MNYYINKLSRVYIEQRSIYLWAPGGLGEGLFTFRELGSTGNYFRGAGEQAHTLGM